MFYTVLDEGRRNNLSFVWTRETPCCCRNIQTNLNSDFNLYFRQNSNFLSRFYSFFDFSSQNPDFFLLTIRSISFLLF